MTNLHDRMKEMIVLIISLADPEVGIQSVDVQERIAKMNLENITEFEYENLRNQMRNEIRKI